MQRQFRRDRPQDIAKVQRRDRPARTQLHSATFATVQNEGNSPSAFAVGSSLEFPSLPLDFDTPREDLDAAFPQDNFVRSLGSLSSSPEPDKIGPGGMAMGVGLKGGPKSERDLPMMKDASEPAVDSPLAMLGVPTMQLPSRQEQEPREILYRSMARVNSLHGILQEVYRDLIVVRDYLNATSAPPQKRRKR